jgi:hypothetical protein
MSEGLYENPPATPMDVAGLPMEGPGAVTPEKGA